MIFDLTRKSLIHGECAWGLEDTGSAMSRYLRCRSKQPELWVRGKIILKWVLASHLSTIPALIRYMTIIAITQAQVNIHPLARERKRTIILSWILAKLRRLLAL